MLYFVVEGKSDSAKLKSIFPNCQTIETNGSEISKETINLIKKVSHSNEVIVFTDPDQPGKKIRQIILEAVPNLKHAFIKKTNAIKNNKVGVAEAGVEDILVAVEFVIKFENTSTKVVSWERYTQLGYVGQNNSKELRTKLCDELNIPYANSKTLFKWINMIGHKL